METMEYKNWVVNVKEEVERMSISNEEEIWKKHSIYRIPTWCADLNRKAYMPQVVSFGPYHYGETHLKPMEEHKRRALVHLLKRTNKPIKHYLAAMKEVLQQLMDSFEQLDEEWRDSEKFLLLMILDGCFMLEILRSADEISNNYASDDPIFGNHGKLYNMPLIRRDMLMIENQVPLLVLEKLIAVEKGGKNEEYIHELILKFCTSNAKATNMGLGLHVLDVVRKSMLHIPHPRPSSSTTPVPFPSLPSFPAHPSTGEIIQSAWELYEAGIRFKKSKTQSLKDIKFRHGILRLPVIVVDDTTGSTFLNLMAFERLHVGAGNEVTSYVCFMDNLIDSEKDVSLLHSKGIIQNAIGSDKAAAKLFNELSKDATLEPDGNLEDVQRKVNDYCKKQWNEWRANLIHTYFRSPWAALSLIAAVFLLVLTVLQTVYSILQYY
ncbi:UPF0481 protein At3g47200-like [Magnolia sinica]|uniref:UPF0481 protein At3g47200-like n=1 Tax=Magnolia sinica TaxID=86752 RepID=UPI00265A4D5D|nr:UPF0481 protein At3g47200-like [Magnolia sinica]